MDNNEALRLIEESVVALCQNCDPNCPVSRLKTLDNKLPHCYQGSFSSNKLYDLMVRVGSQNPELTAEDETVIGQEFNNLL